jgi:hypothetical protein
MIQYVTSTYTANSSIFIIEKLHTETVFSQIKLYVTSTSYGPLQFVIVIVMVTHCKAFAEDSGV